MLDDDLENIFESTRFSTGRRDPRGAKGKLARKLWGNVLDKGCMASRFHHKRKRPVTLAKIEIKPCPT